ncbi:MAG TPA: Flp family type IVb pilin [Caulobacteraceae bacterium]|nr:Flp family type IVb pilin [Caulobacteraceae bacterium]
MKDLASRLAKDEGGATAVEYALIVASIFLVVVSAITTFAQNAGAMFDAISAAITAVM